MRILTINSSDISGGSAIAAYRLSKGLERLYDGVEIFFAVGRKDSSDPKVFWTRNNWTEYYVEKIIDNITNRMGLQYFWFPFSTKRLLRQAMRLKPDILYFRNIHGGYFETGLIQKLTEIAPIVWTLSDMWSFTGHCAHSFGDMSWKQMESGCPDKQIYPGIGIDTGKWLLKRKQSIYRNANITIVTPSKWLYNLAKQSPVLKNKEIVQIYNGFDLNGFRPKDKQNCRRILDIPPESKVLMFCAKDLTGDPWKGGSHLINILKLINHMAKNNIHLLIVGEGEARELYEFENLVVHPIGYIQDDTLMATCFSASDVFIYPTRADNLPNVLIEAISCGTPCVTFDVGGCPEIIENEVSGIVVPPDDPETFSLNVMEILASDEKQHRFSINARKSAEENFTLEKMCKNYYKLFLKAIQSVSEG